MAAVAASALAAAPRGPESRFLERRALSAVPNAACPSYASIMQPSMKGFDPKVYQGGLSSAAVPCIVMQSPLAAGEDLHQGVPPP